MHELGIFLAVWIGSQWLLLAGLGIHFAWEERKFSLSEESEGA